MQPKPGNHGSRFVAGLDIVTRWGAYVGAVLLLFMAGIIGYDVAMRKFFDKPTDWAVDFAQYIMAYATFLGGAWVLKIGGHVKIDFLEGALNPTGKRIMSIFNATVGFAVCAVVAWQGILASWDAYKFHLVMPRPIEVPKYALLVVIPFGMILMMIYFVIRVIHILGGGSDGKMTGGGNR